MLNYSSLLPVATLFLETANALDKFNDNLAKVADYRTFSSLEEAVTQEPCDFISGAFSWKDTPEGVQYWYRLAEIWKKFMESTL